MITNKTPKLVKARDRHKPIHRGVKYCSPACGFGCTWKAYRQALKESKALARRLGQGWVSNVWENGTWYWSVKDSTGVLDMHQTGKKKYTLYVERVIGTSGNFVVEGTTPEKAVIAAIKRIEEECTYMMKRSTLLVASCLDVLGRTPRRRG